MKNRFVALLAATAALLATINLRAELDPAIQAKIDAAIPAIKALAAEPELVGAVLAYNAAPSAEAKAMTQDKWKTLTLLDPFVRGFTKNEAAEVLKATKPAVVVEAFVSGADGGKVAFLAKTTSWSHVGKAKHDQPMAGHVWQGNVEIDESTGLQQVQVGVPVLDGDTPVGSLVVGVSISKLKE